MNKKNLLWGVVLSTSLVSNLTFAAVKIGDNPSILGPSSLLELESTSKGLVISRVENTAAIASPMNGMLIYDISANCVKGYQNDDWSDCMSAGSASSIPSTGTLGGGAVTCNEAFMDPLSVGTYFARGHAESGVYNTDEDFLIILDKTGKRFFNNTDNPIYDLDAQSLLTSNGVTGDITTTAVLPTYYGRSQDGVTWSEMKVFGQLFPTKTWKQFSNLSFVGTGSSASAYPHYWMLLLSTDGELKAVRYQIRSSTASLPYSGVSGRDGVGKTCPTVTAATTSADFYKYTDIKAYSDVDTPTATNWDWFEPYFNGHFSSSASDFVNAVLAYNAADNLFYTWGARNFSGSQTLINMYPNILLRTNPTNITQSMTPLPATVLNNLLVTLGTTVKKPSDEHSTIIVSRRGADARPYLTFITNNNKVIRYGLDNNNYTVLSLPTGVNPVSISYYATDGNHIEHRLYILGSDGKLYIDTTSPTSVAQAVNVTTFANAAFGTASYPNIKQYVSGVFLTQDGKLGLINTLGTLVAELQKQTVPMTRIMSYVKNSTPASTLFKDNMGNFGEYVDTANADYTSPRYIRHGYRGNKFSNFLAEKNIPAYNMFLNSNQYFPIKCVSY